MADRPFRILVVCVGNICRSPLAELLLAARLRALGAGEAVAVSSAGLADLRGRAMHPESAAQLVALGGDPGGFASRGLTPALVEEADLVLTATVDIRRRVLEEVPAAIRRVFTLREFALLVADAAGGGDVAGPVAGGDAGGCDVVAWAAARRGRAAGHDLDVPDPIGRPVHVHAEAARLIAEAVDAIAPVLARTTQGSR